MRQRVIALVVVLVAATALVAVAVASGGGGGGRNALPKLPIGSAGEASTAMATTDGRAAAPGLAPVPGNGFAPDFRVAGQLPELGGTATAYGFRGTVSSTAVAKLAGALGIDGKVTRDGDVFTASGAAGVLQVQAGGAGPWIFMPGCTAVGTDIQCSGAGSSGSGVAIACVVPPCAPGASCPAIAACDGGDTPAPTRPAGIPAKDEAVAVARTVLTRAGVDLGGADVRADDAWSQWSVTVEPALDGRAVRGMSTVVAVGAGSKVTFASGFLGQPVKLGDYPLAGTAAGLDRLQKGTWVGIGPVARMGVVTAGGGGVTAGIATATATATASAPATIAAAPPAKGSAEPGVAKPNEAAPLPPEPSTGPPVCAPDAKASCDPAGPAPTPMPVPTPVPAPPTNVTGVHLVLALTAGPDGVEALVPAYAFETDAGGGETLPLVPAVTDDLLQDKPPGDVPGTKPVPTPEPAVQPTPAIKTATP